LFGREMVLIGLYKNTPKKIIVMEIIATVHLIPNIVANPYLINRFQMD